MKQTINGYDFEVEKQDKKVLWGGISDFGQPESTATLRKLVNKGYANSLYFIETNETLHKDDIVELIFEGYFKNVTVTHLGPFEDLYYEWRFKRLPWEKLEGAKESVEGKEAYEKEFHLDFVKMVESLNITLLPMDVFANKVHAGALGLPGITVPLNEARLYRTEEYINDNLINGFVFEEAITADLGFISAPIATKYGNIIYGNQTNYNSVDVAKASRETFVEVDKILTDDEEIKKYSTDIENLFVTEIRKKTEETEPLDGIGEKAIKRWKFSNYDLDIREYDPKNIKDRIAIGINKILPKYSVVNLGYGIPINATELLANKRLIQMESCVVGVKDLNGTDSHVVDPGGNMVSLLNNGYTVKNVTDSFSEILNGRVDYTVLGALQVDFDGNLASHAISEKELMGFGGAVALAGNCDVVVAMREKTRNGESKIVDNITMPMTGHNCVKFIVTEEHIYQKDLRQRGFNVIYDFNLDTMEYEARENEDER